MAKAKTPPISTAAHSAAGDLGSVGSSNGAAGADDGAARIAGAGGVQAGCAVGSATLVAGTELDAPPAPFEAVTTTAGGFEAYGEGRSWWLICVGSVAAQPLSLPRASLVRVTASAGAGTTCG